jgi:hypothetical protein
MLSLCICSSRVTLRLHTENQLHKLPGSASKVCVVVVGGVESEFSDHFGYSLALAKPNIYYFKRITNINKQALFMRNDLVSFNQVYRISLKSFIIHKSPATTKVFLSQIYCFMFLRTLVNILKIDKL